MDSLLTELQIARGRDHDAGNEDEFLIREIRPVSNTSQRDTTRQIGRPARLPPSDVEDLTSLLTFLRNSPEPDALTAVLTSIDEAKPDDKLYLRDPGAQEAQVIKCLVDSIIPDFWHTLSSTDRTHLARSIRSLSGVGSILTSIRFLTSQAQSLKSPAAPLRNIADLISALSLVLPAESSTVLKELWIDLARPDDRHKAKRHAAWQEVVNLFGSGKITSTIAEAEDALKKIDSSASFPLLPGERYARWLATQIASLALEIARTINEDRQIAAAQVLGKATTLGYTQDLVQALLFGLCKQTAGLHVLPLLLKHMAAPARQRFLQSLVAWLSNSFPTPPLAAQKDTETQPRSLYVPNVAGLFSLLIEADPCLHKEMMSLLHDAATTVLFSSTVREAAIASFAHNNIVELAQVLTRIITVFGDQLFIDHASSSQQDALAQTILISAGYIHRMQPERLVRIARSADHLQGVSSRLAASSERGRWLGMIVGTALSRLTDDSATKMDFGTADMAIPEAAMFLDLINIDDKPGNPDELLSAIRSSVELQTRPTVDGSRAPHEMPKINGKQSYGPIPPPNKRKRGSNSSRRIDRSSNELGDDPDLRPYAKPDSDPEDSEEDATLVNRKKVRPPVYVRSLMDMLRQHEDAERFQMGLKHAATLIRRKTGVGREISDHAEELARILTHMQDPFDTEGFDTMRLQAMIALIISDVHVIAPWASHQAFASDYSIAQRMMLLAAVGLSGRELAGLQSEDKLNPPLEGTHFSSKQLPSHLHAIYAQHDTVSRALDGASRIVEQELIQPMAHRAADQTTSQLDAVKVRTFSSRIDAERTRRKPKANALAQTFKHSYFDPLVSSIQANIAAYQDSSVYASTPILLATYLKTLAVLVHAAGPITLELFQITSDMWTLLLYLRVKAVESALVMEGVLLGFLALFDVNTDQQRIATELTQQLMETKEWVEMVFDRTSGGSLVQEATNDDESRVRSLSAAVLTKAHEIIDTYQKALMGRWADL